MITVASILVIVMVITAIGKLATIALTATGLPLEMARFQARSLLTGVGFTTSESETVINHPTRRRIAMLLMLVGNAGLVTILASVTLSFVTSGGTGDILLRLGILIVGLLAFAALISNKRFERIISAGLSKLLSRYSDLELYDFHHLMQLSADYAITELAVAPGSWLADRTLLELDLPDEGVLVLAVNRADGTFIGAPRGNTTLHPYDDLVLYGRSQVLTDLAVRRHTPEGDLAHSAAVAEQEVILTELAEEEQRTEDSRAPLPQPDDDHKG